MSTQVINPVLGPANDPRQLQSFNDVIQRLIQEEFETVKCDDCQAARGKPNAQSPCPEHSAGPYCARHTAEHLIDRHAGDPAWLEFLGRHAADFQLKNGQFLTLCTSAYGAFGAFNDVIKPESRAMASQRTAWYALARYLDCNPGIVTKWRYPREDDGESAAMLDKAVHKFCQATGLRFVPGMEINGSTGIILFLAPARKLGDRDIAAEAGITVNHGGANKIAKRRGVYSLGDAAAVVPQPSYFTNDQPAINLPLGERITLAVKNTRYISRSRSLGRGAGDGAGVIRKSAAIRLIRAMGETGSDRKNAKLRKLQVNIAGADAFLKGVWRIVPDHIFPSTNPHLDLIVDADSVSNQVVNTRYTVIRLIRKNFKPQHGFIAIEPLLQADWVEKLLDPAELAQVQAELMPRLHQEDRAKAMDTLKRKMSAFQKGARYLTANEGEDNDRQQWSDSAADLLMNEALSTQFADGMLQTGARLSGPFASGPGFSQAAGRIPNTISGKHQRNQPLIPTFASGAHADLTYAFYNGGADPKPGYLRLFFDEKHPDHLTEFSLSRQDAFRLEDALDTSDCDDSFTLIFLTLPDGNPGCLILKLPMSVQGGAILRVNREDAKKLKALGYHFYRLQPDIIPENAVCHPIYHINPDGQPEMPDRLTAPPLTGDQLPVMPQGREGAIERLTRNRQFRAEVGRATNLSQAIYISGLWEESLKFGMSGQVVDPVENGDRNPGAIVEDLTKFLYDAVTQGQPVDQCVSGRITSLLNQRHKQVEGPDAPPLAINTFCRHDQRRRNLETLIREEQRKLRRREAAANGPIDLLLDAPIPDGLTKIVANALTKRDEAWSACQSSIKEFNQETESWIDRFGITRTRTHSRQERKIHEAVEKRRARTAEQKAMDHAYQQAQQLDDYTPGSIHFLWTMLWLYRKAGKTVSVYSLAKLPDHEHRAYFETGVSRPIIALKSHQQHADNADQLEPGATVQLKGAKNGRQSNYWLRDPESGKNLIRVTVNDEVKAIAPEGRHCSLQVIRVINDPEGKDDKGRLILLDMTPNLPNG